MPSGKWVAGCPAALGFALEGFLPELNEVLDQVFEFVTAPYWQTGPASVRNVPLFENQP
jgi:hypothetical protein